MFAEEEIDEEDDLEEVTDDEDDELGEEESEDSEGVVMAVSPHPRPGSRTGALVSQQNTVNTCATKDSISYRN